MIFAIAVLAFALLSLVLGFIIGMVRGRNRSVLRLILIIVSIVLAFCFKGVVADAIMNIDAGDGKTIVESLAADFSGGMEFMGDIVIAIVKAFLEAVAFLVCCLGALILTGLILYPIGKIVVRKPKEGESKHALAGGIVGLVGGVLVMYFVCAPFSCGLTTVAEVYTMVQEIKTTSGSGSTTLVPVSDYVYAEETSSGSEQTSSGSDSASSQTSDFVQKVYDFSNTGIGKFFNAIGRPVFKLIASTGSGENKTSLDGQLEGVKATVDLAASAKKFRDVTNGGKLTEDNIAEIKSILKEMDDIKGGLSDEGKKTATKILNGIKDKFGDEVSVDLSAIDLTDVEFAHEGKIVEDIYKFASGTGEKNAKEIVSEVADSKLVLPVMEQVIKSGVELSADQKQQINKEISELGENVTDETKAKLRQAFGL